MTNSIEIANETLNPAAFIGFPSISGYHNIWKEMQLYFAAKGTRPPEIIYRSKVKLHGTNAAMRLNNDVRAVAPQKRNEVIGGPKDGHYGFREFAFLTEVYWHDLAMKHDAMYQTVIFFGEWAGPGIQKNVAVSKIEHKQFFVFAALLVHLSGDRQWAVEPIDLDNLLHPMRAHRPNNIRVVPWHTYMTAVDYNDREGGALIADDLNAHVSKIDKIDPYILNEFGVEGVGEGLVFYPRSRNGQHMVRLTDSEMGRLFKVKGPSHGEAGAEKKARLKPGPSASALEFTAEHVSEARLEQGLREVCGDNEPARHDIGKFIAWVARDVLKECKDELEASGLDWNKEVAGLVTVRARAWLFNKMGANNGT